MSSGLFRHLRIGLASSLLLVVHAALRAQTPAAPDLHAVLRAEAGTMPGRSEDVTVLATGRASVGRAPEVTKGETIPRRSYKESVSLADVKEGKKTSKSRLVYPEAAKAAGIVGVVLVQGLIDREGRVTDLRVVKGVAALDDAALSEVRKWRYQPTTVKGEPRAVILTVTMRFVLSS